MSIAGSVAAFAVVAGLLTIIPGVDTAVVLRTALTRDRRSAAATAAGILSGTLVWGVAASVGAAALLAPQFIPPHAPHLAMGVLLALVHDVEGLIWFAAITVGAHAARRLLDRPAVHRAIDRITGTVLVAFGLRIALRD